MSNERDILIEAYVQGKLAGEELVQFEQMIGQDAALKELVAVKFAERDVLETMAANLLRQQILEEYKHIEPSPVRKKNAYLSYVLLGILLLASLIYYKVNIEKEELTTGYAQEKEDNADQANDLPLVKTPEIIEDQPSKGVDLPKVKIPDVTLPIKIDFKKVIRAAYSIPVALLQTRGDSDEGAYNTAIKAFEQKNYSKVLELLKSLPEEEEQEALSLRAHAYFNLGKYKEALSDFRSLQEGGIYKREGEWYGLLAAIAINGEKDPSWQKDLDLILKNVNHPFYKEALQLSKAIK
ncbi:MAG TPA: hypothetical protein PLY70_14670 [Saprospiraceae bacterium]|nr:hypothetical protein [Saprospiraceae bacterium]